MYIYFINASINQSFIKRKQWINLLYTSERLLSTAKDEKQVILLSARFKVIPEPL